MPSQFAWSVGVFAGEGIGEGRAGEVIEDIASEDIFNRFDLSLEGGDAGSREDGDAVFTSFAADEDGTVIEVDVFDAEGEAFGDTEAGAIEEGDLEVFGFGEEFEDFVDFSG